MIIAGEQNPTEPSKLRLATSKLCTIRQATTTAIMKLSQIPTISVLISIQQMVSIAQGFHLQNEASSHSLMQSKLIDRCCQVGKDRAIESAKFNCKLAARDALIGGQFAPTVLNHRLELAAEQLLSRDPNFVDQCELVLESCCMAHHRTKNCDSGKQLAKSGASCMDVELSKEATIATESFNDCCMSCSLGILAAKNGPQNDTASSRLNLATRCKLLSPLASSLSGQLYEQTYAECCQENLPRPSDALLEPGAPIDCSQSNPCSQRCISAGTYDLASRRVLDQDRCECFAGYKLASDRINCVDIDECKLGLHSCDKRSELCDNIKGSFRCLARHHLSPSPMGAARSAVFNHNHNQNHHQHQPEPGNGALMVEEFQPLRLCPPGSRWSAEEKSCSPISATPPETNNIQRSASLFSSGLHLLSSSGASTSRLVDS